MRPTTSGVYRAFESPRDRGDEWLLVDGEGDPTYVAASGYGDSLAATVAGLRPGYRVAATIEWQDDEARFADLAVESPTLFAFVDGTPDIFEAARETFRAGVRENVGVNSRVTRDTDGDPNGVLYTFAEQSGARDVFAEMRDGRTPLEPLVEKAIEGGRDPPFEVFVLRPAGDGDPFVVVYLAFEKGGLLADTVRDEYGCPRPDEPLVG
ncbi:hypothetical protein BRC83_00835 [Halobacteriales archaeon QS_1_68_17]|nr:MAG: hypothetical protein BRC83_00835 [Halobacteriales archaeon QS_1_68_17]